MDGNSVTADPVNNQEVTPSNGASGAPEGAGGSNDLQAKVAKLEEQYSASSREAHRLVEELKQEREARIRLESSLTKNNEAQQGFPPEETYVKHWVELGTDEKVARAQYRESKLNYDNQMFLNKQLAALQNQFQFQRQESERAFQETNSEAQKAVDFWKDSPVMNALPIADRISEMKRAQSKLGVKIEGRDTTAIKLAASGGGSGSGARSVDQSNTSQLDQEAKNAGFSCYKEMDECSKATTPQEYAEYKKRWKK